MDRVTITSYLVKFILWNISYKDKKFNYTRLYKNKGLLNYTIYIKTVGNASCQSLKNCFNSPQQNLWDTDFLQYFLMIYNGITWNIQNRYSCTCVLVSSNWYCIYKCLIQLWIQALSLLDLTHDFYDSKPSHAGLPNVCFTRWVDFHIYHIVIHHSIVFRQNVLAGCLT